MRTILLAVAACVACLGRPLDALSLRGQRTEADGVEGPGEEASGARLLKRVRRGWMWNQFFLQEEYTGSDYQYIGKVGAASLVPTVSHPYARADRSYRAIWWRIKRSINNVERQKTCEAAADRYDLIYSLRAGKTQSCEFSG